MVGYKNKEIDKINETLNKEFDMKYLGEDKRIIGMDIMRNRERGELLLSQSNYLNKVVKCFRMLDAKTINIYLGYHTKLSVI